MKYKYQEEKIIVPEVVMEYEVESDEKEIKKRIDRVKEAMAYSELDCPPPDEEVIKISYMAVNGEISDEEAKQLIIDFCKKKYLEG
ncbi:MAG: antitoxin VbhA family protein [Clostridium chrysemydis]|uniref:antitoxin VbhA family protein n=1 Tax=Clostridium chrysemydis TaxID=2665504 RepID=UPI003F307F8C